MNDLQGNCHGRNSNKFNKKALQFSVNLLTDNFEYDKFYHVIQLRNQIACDWKEMFGMSTEKKPIATVKASFNSKAAGEAHKAETVKEAGKKISEKKTAVVKAAAKTPEKTAAPVKEAKAKAEDTKALAAKEEKKVEKKVEKKEEDKKTAPVKAVEKKSAPVKTAEKKETPVKTAEKKAAPVKAAEKKAAPATKKAAEKKASSVKKETAPAAKTETEVILQWNGNDYTYDRLLQSAKDVWQYDQGKNVADFKKAAIYVKPEENKAYVVVNDKDELSFDI